MTFRADPNRDDLDAIQDRLTKARPALPPQLRRAAAYVLENPGDVATLSMRKVASAAQVAAPNFARLAKAIGFGTYDELREVYRKHVQRGAPFAYQERALSLQFSGADHGVEAVWSSFRAAAFDGIKSVFDHVDAGVISSVAEALHRRQRIYLAGMQASQPFVRYLHYIGGMVSPSMRLVGREGSVVADDLADMGERDAIICLALRPCARATVQIARIARQRSVLVVGITDSRASPLAAMSDYPLLVPTESPMFFESYIGATAVIEMLVGFYVMGEGACAVERIERIEADRRRFGEYWNEEDG